MDKTTDKIKQALTTVNGLAKYMNEDQVDKLIDILDTIAQQIESRDKATPVSNDPYDMLERIRIRLATKEIKPILEKVTVAR